MRYVLAAKRAQGRMPLKLKGVLARSNIRQNDWSSAVRQFDGRPLSDSAATILLNWNVWPRKTPRESIVAQTRAFLEGRNIPEEWISGAFDPEEHGDPYRQAKRKRAHLKLKPLDDVVPAIEPVEVEMLSAEARKHFALFKDPFVNDVLGSDDVFLAPDQRYIREAMHQTAKHGGFLAVIGESGSGKTTLRRDLIESSRNEPITYIQPRVFDKGKLTAGLICDAIILDISTQAPKRSLEAKSRQVEKILVGSASAGNSHVLMIEEAHDLNVQTLKYLKRFWEMEHGFKKLLGVILIGQPELKAMLDERQNYEAREVIRRCEVAQLEPLNGNLEDYLALKFRRCGKKLDEVFAKSAFDEVRNRLTQRRRSSNGDQVFSHMYPLVVNRLVTLALNEAASIGAPKIDADVIKALS